MRRAFTLIELMVVVAIIAIVAAVAIPSMIQSRIASNETATVANMRSWLNAQNIFRNADQYGIKRFVYANAVDGYGYTDLHEVPADKSGTGKAERIDLVDLGFARASKAPTSPYAGELLPKAGYYFIDVDTDSAGNAYDYDYECGLYAAPARLWRTGYKEFVIDISGAAHGRMASSQADPKTQCPDLDSGWMPASD